MKQEHDGGNPAVSAIVFLLHFLNPPNGLL